MLKPRADTHAGCGKKPKGNGREKASAGPTDASSNLGGIFVPSNTAADTTAGSSTPVQAGTTTVVVLTTVTIDAAVDAASTADVPETTDAVASALPTSAQVLQAFQKSQTLVTSYSAAPVALSTSATQTSTVEKGSDGGSGAAKSSSEEESSGPLPTGDADSLTVVLRNLMDSSLTTSHGMNDGLPVHVQAITATLTDGVMAPGVTATMVYPSGWAGMMVAAKVASSEDEVVDLANGSLLEGSFVNQMNDEPVGDIDISYV